MEEKRIVSIDDVERLAGKRLKLDLRNSPDPIQRRFNQILNEERVNRAKAGRGVRSNPGYSEQLAMLDQAKAELKALGPDHVLPTTPPPGEATEGDGHGVGSGPEEGVVSPGEPDNLEPAEGRTSYRILKHGEKPNLPSPQDVGIPRWMDQD